MGNNNPNSTAKSRLHQQIKKHTKPPDDEGLWQAFTMEFLESEAFRSLSVNAQKALMRIVVEHIAHGRWENGRLIVTHDDFVQYGCTSDLVADAIAELNYKGIAKVKYGRGGSGTNHPNRYRLTFTGDCDGAPASNDWKTLSIDYINSWPIKRKILSKERARKQPLKSKSPLGNLLGAPLGKNLERNPETRKSPSGKPARKTPRTIDIMASNAEQAAQAEGRSHSAPSQAARSNVISFTYAQGYQQAESDVVEALGGWESISLEGEALEALVNIHLSKALNHEQIRAECLNLMMIGTVKETSSN